MLYILLFFIAHWYLSLFLQTFLQHRYAAHGSFTMSKFWERFFYLSAYFVQGSSYISPRVYGIMHRMHHAYADTEKDPHSPLFDKNYFSIMWAGRNYAISVYKNQREIEPRFLKNLPDWPMLDKIGHSTFSRLGWIVIYTLIYIQFAPSAWYYLMIPLHVLTVPISGAIINWFAHKYGSTTFPMKNTSTNLFKFDLLMMGEAYHNNHHRFPGRINFGFKWHEVDPTYMVMRVLAKLRIIRVNPVVE